MQPSLSEVQTMVAEIDTDGSGAVDFEEFLQVNMNGRGGGRWVYRPLGRVVLGAEQQVHMQSNRRLLVGKSYSDAVTAFCVQDCSQGVLVCTSCCTPCQPH